MKKQIHFLFLGLFLLTACAKQSESAKLPASWHGLPENALASFNTDDDFDQEPIDIGRTVDTYSQATGEALEQVPEQTASSGQNFLGTNKVPWHMEYMMTDLAVSAGGVLGGLIMKGTPGVTFIWRKQNPQTLNALEQINSKSSAQIESASQSPDLSITANSTDQDMAMQLEPAIRAAVASGKVTDGNLLRTNLLAAAKDFQTLAGGLGENPGLTWWVSRLRLDLSVDGSAKVSPVISVGGAVRFRFEWHRIMRKAQTTPSAPFAISKFSIQSSSLQEFVSAMAEDLSALSDDPQQPSGFKAYGFRVGIGVTAKGQIGIAKAGVGLVGQVYFSRDVSKPVVHPKQLSELSEIPVIESAALQPAHMYFAAANNIAFERELVSASPAEEQVVYQVDRKKIRKGLLKAAKISHFFGKHSAQSHHGKWKVYELRTSFDLSISGKIGVTELGGTATTEINFYNQGF